MTIKENISLASASSFEELIKQAPDKGLFLEFGVYYGTSIKTIASLTENTVYGFDSFTGLPEERYIYQKGHFSVDKEQMPTMPDNVILIKGLFEDTLPVFKKYHVDKIALIHIDCDLYSSTKCVFNNLKHLFQTGTILLFDELINYPGHEQHEIKAFEEFLKETKYTYECIGTYGIHQVGFKINV